MQNIQPTSAMHQQAQPMKSLDFLSLLLSLMWCLVHCNVIFSWINLRIERLYFSLFFHRNIMLCYVNSNLSLVCNGKVEQLHTYFIFLEYSKYPEYEDSFLGRIDEFQDNFSIIEPIKNFGETYMKNIMDGPWGVLFNAFSAVRRNYNRRQDQQSKYFHKRKSFNKYY